MDLENHVTDENAPGVSRSVELVRTYDLPHHIGAQPLELQYSELVAIHFGSFALSRGPLMSGKTAKRFVKYLWSLTIGLLPYDGPVHLPPITAQDIRRAVSYANSLIKRGKSVARLLAIADFDALTRTYPDNDISYLCSSPGESCDEDSVSHEDGPFRHPAIGMIICRMLSFASKGDICLSEVYFYPKMPKVFIIFVCGLIRFALDEFNTGSYLKLSFTEWAQDYSWNHIQALWDAAENIDGGAYIDGVQQCLARQLRNAIDNTRHSALNSPPEGPLFPWDQPDRSDELDTMNQGSDTDATLVN